MNGYIESSSEHYRYYCPADSTAARNLEHIKKIQEKSFEKIVDLLGVKPDFPLRYILCETSEEVGRAYGDNEPCNGFADSPDTVFAVYNEKVRCIGPHEDTHLIAELIAHPASSFIREGLAMYMDEEWWGKGNTAWVSDFLADGRYVGVDQLLDNESFWSYPDEITYPLAGAFTLWLIEQLGMRKYLDQIYVTGDHAAETLEKTFGCSVKQVDQLFCSWIRSPAEENTI